MRIEISITRKIAFGFALALLILMGVGMMSHRITVQFAESTVIVARTHQTQSLLLELLADVVSAESEARGYAITGNEVHLHLYHKEIRDVESDLKALKEATITSNEVRERLATLEPLVRNRLSRLESTVTTRRLEGLDAVREAAGLGKKLMDELRAAVAGVDDVLDRLLAERDRQSKALANRMIVVVVTGSLLAVLVAAASTIVLVADIKHRERLEKEVMEISEREQRRIGDDLHDGLCQELTGISLLSRSLQQKLAASSLPESTEAECITRLINAGIEQTRQVTRGLHPVPDEPAGLMLALEELANKVRTTSKLACRFDCPEPVLIPDSTVATHLYRIAQEAVQNALRHARAATINIRLKSDEESTTLAVIDDGCGIPDRVSGQGMGLDIMKYRAHAIGARVVVRRGDECGTAVCCALTRSALDLEETAS